jgi:hypothetical protein
MLGIALFIGGATAALPAVFCLLAFTVLWVLARLKIFGQRNGVFFALSVIALMGAAVGLIQQAWRSFGASGDSARAPGVALRDTDSMLSPVTSPPEPPFMMEALKLETPDADLPRVRAIRDLVTTVGGRSYRIRKGDTFLFADEKPQKFIISANEMLAQVPMEATEYLPPERVKAADHAGGDTKGALEKSVAAQVEQRSRAEALKRYPALGKAGSVENKAFVETYNTLKARKSDMLDDPEWPLHLAEYLAQRMGWEEAPAEDDPTGESPAVVEPKIAPGTRMLAEPDAEAAPLPAAPTAPIAPANGDTGDDDSGIPPPPPTPR